MATALLKSGSRPRFESTIVAGTPTVVRVSGSDGSATVVGVVPATAALTVEYTLSSWEAIEGGSAVWISSGITFTAGATTAGTISAKVNGLRATATTLNSTLQVMV